MKLYAHLWGIAEEGTLKGHSFGNILLAGLEKTAGSYIKGVEIASDILGLKGRLFLLRKCRQSRSYA